MKIIALFLIALIYSSDAVTTWDFSGNVSKTQTGGIDAAEFAFRKTDVWIVPLGGLATFAGYTSLAVNVQGSNSTISGSANLIVGAIKFIIGTHPVSYFGTLSAQGSVNLAGTDTSNFDYSIAGGFILSSFLRIEERDPSGSVVRTVKFSSLIFSATSGKSSTGSLYYVTMTANNGFLTPLGSSEVVSLTFLVSEILGTVQAGSISVPVTPKTLESIIDIENWDYKSSGNNLVLVCGVVTGSGSGSSSGSVDIATGSGENQVYANFAKHVDVGGTKKSVTINKSSSSDISLVLEDIVVKAAVSAVYNSSIMGHTVEINLPPGASKITYDPAIGSGQPLNYNGSEKYLITFLLFAIAVLLL